MKSTLLWPRTQNDGSLFTSAVTPLFIEEFHNCEQAITEAVTACQREVFIQNTVAAVSGSLNQVLSLVQRRLQTYSKELVRDI